MKLRNLVLSVTALFWLAGCGAEPRSDIVAKAEAAGSGKLSRVSQDGMKQWLGQPQRRYLPNRRLCVNRCESRATALWAESTEGRLCSAARELAFFRSGPVRNSGQDVLAGQVEARAYRALLNSGATVKTRHRRTTGEVCFEFFLSQTEAEIHLRALASGYRAVQLIRSGCRRAAATLQHDGTWRHHDSVS